MPTRRRALLCPVCRRKTPHRREIPEAEAFMGSGDMDLSLDLEGLLEAIQKPWTCDVCGGETPIDLERDVEVE